MISDRNGQKLLNLKALKPYLKKISSHEKKDVVRVLIVMFPSDSLHFVLDPGYPTHTFTTLFVLVSAG